MTNYEKYLTGKSVLLRVQQNILLGLGRKSNGALDTNNDKASLSFDEKANCPSVFLVNMTYGYYGSSSGYSAMDTDTSRYLRMACNAMKVAIGEKAIELASSELLRLREQARDEAKSILEEIPS